MQFSNSYVDQLFAERNVAGLYTLVSVMERERQLPEEFWLFCRMREWVGSTRSGVWQYYERLPDEKFKRMAKALGQFGFKEALEQYKVGQASWNGFELAKSVDRWILQHERELESATFELIAKRSDCLKQA
jgi:hypothetical protein